MFNYPIFFLGLYFALSNYMLDNDFKHFKNFYDVSAFKFDKKEKKTVVNTEIDSTLLFPKLISKGTLKEDSPFKSIEFQAKYQIKYLIISDFKNISLIPSIKQANSFESIVKNNKQDGYLLMNAGMFQPNFNAVGLTISDGEIKQDLDTTSTPKNGNFYLYPNGVFTIDKKNKPIIHTTDDFLKKKIDPKGLSLATQSGPMLVIDNKIHPAFSSTSKNTNVRNGVGINDKGQIVFAISETEISFYDFATFFKDELHCKYALYLDGTISEIYYRDKETIWHTPRISSGKFGPIFMVRLQEEKK